MARRQTAPGCCLALLVALGCASSSRASRLQPLELDHRLASSPAAREEVVVGDPAPDSGSGQPAWWTQLPSKFPGNATGGAAALREEAPGSKSRCQHPIPAQGAPLVVVELGRLDHGGPGLRAWACSSSHDPDSCAPSPTLTSWVLQGMEAFVNSSADDDGLICKAVAELRNIAHDDMVKAPVGSSLLAWDTARAAGGMRNRWKNLRDWVGMTPDVCAVCLDDARRPTALACRHTFCRDCLSQWLRRQSECPLCRKPVLEAELPVDKLKVRALAHAGHITYVACGVMVVGVVNKNLVILMAVNTIVLDLSVRYALRR